MADENKPQPEQEPSELEKVQQERDEYLAGWQRAKADFINYQKEEQARLAGFIGFAKEDLISDILFVLDSFDLAILNAKDENEKRNFELIQLQLLNILKKNGLEKIETQLGEPLNPSLQEVVEAVAGSESPPQTVVEISCAGYKLNGRVIRATRVKVAK